MDTKKDCPSAGSLLKCAEKLAESLKSQEAGSPWGLPRGWEAFELPYRICISRKTNRSRVTVI